MADEFAELGDPLEVSDLGADPPSPNGHEPSGDIPPKGQQYCEGCGEIIHRAPGQRGRTPKRHPECKAEKASPSSAGSARGKGRSSKAEREADAIRQMWDSGVVKAALMLAAVDPYDGMTVAVGGKEMGKNIPGIMVRHDRWREDILSMQSGGSILGFALAGLMTVLPILAHHGLIPHAQITKILETVPTTVLKMNKRLENAEESLHEEFRKAEAAAREQARQETASASNGHGT